ncbi:hypothetical protein ACLOJK_035333 [Asimina triloba]
MEHQYGAPSSSSPIQPPKTGGARSSDGQHQPDVTAPPASSSPSATSEQPRRTHQRHPSPPITDPTNSRSTPKRHVVRQPTHQPTATSHRHAITPLPSRRSQQRASARSSNPARDDPSPRLRQRTAGDPPPTPLSSRPAPSNSRPAPVTTQICITPKIRRLPSASNDAHRSGHGQSSTATHRPSQRPSTSSSIAHEHHAHHVGHPTNHHASYDPVPMIPSQQQPHDPTPKFQPHHFASILKSSMADKLTGERYRRGEQGGGRQGEGHHGQASRRRPGQG